MLDKIDWVMEDLNYQWMGSRLYPLGNVEPLTHSEEQHILLRIIYWTGMLGEDGGGREAREKAVAITSLRRLRLVLLSYHVQVIGINSSLRH